MSGVAVIRHMLAHDPQLTFIVPPVRIVGGMLPINTELPAISIQEISGSEFTVIRRDGNNTASERIQVSIIAPTYIVMKQMLEFVRAAIKSTRGTVNTISVDSVTFEMDGPYLNSQDPIIHEQSIDYMVRFYR